LAIWIGCLSIACFFGLCILFLYLQNIYLQISKFTPWVIEMDECAVDLAFFYNFSLPEIFFLVLLEMMHFFLTNMFLCFLAHVAAFYDFSEFRSLQIFEHIYKLW
ncbi:hypothetical protein ACJX0J_027422, partial [Zea mays]